MVVGMPRLNYLFKSTGNCCGDSFCFTLVSKVANLLKINHYFI